MAKFVLQTGFAIIKDKDGRVRNKLCFTPGEFELDYPFEFTVEDIESERALNSIKVFKPVTPELQAERDRLAARESARQKIKDFDLSSANSIAQIKTVLKDIVDLLK